MKNGEELLKRPDDRDRNDEILLTQTHLEQIASNQSFRSIADYFDQVQSRPPDHPRPLARRRRR